MPGRPYVMLAAELKHATSFGKVMRSLSYSDRSHWKTKDIRKVNLNLIENHTDLLIVSRKRTKQIKLSIYTISYSYLH